MESSPTCRVAVQRLHDGRSMERESPEYSTGTARLIACAIAAAVVVLLAACGESRNDGAAVVTPDRSAEAVSGTAAPGTAPVDVPQPTLSPGDSRYINEALRLGMAHVAIAQNVMQRSNAPAVDQIAREIIDTHGSVNAELTALARKHEAPVPAEPSAELHDLAARLRGLSGRELDVGYVTALVERYPELARVHNVASTTATDMAVKDLAVRSEAIFKTTLRKIRDAYAVVTGEAPPPLPPEGGSPVPATARD